MGIRDWQGMYTEYRLRFESNKSAPSFSTAYGSRVPFPNIAAWNRHRGNNWANNTIRSVAETRRAYPSVTNLVYVWTVSYVLGFLPTSTWILRYDLSSIFDAIGECRLLFLCRVWAPCSNTIWVQCSLHPQWKYANSKFCCYRCILCFKRGGVHKRSIRGP